MARRVRFSLNDEKRAGKAAAPITGGVVSSVLFIFVLVITAISHGKCGNYIGAVGLVGLLSAGYGFFIGVKEISARYRKRKKVFYSTVLSLVMFVIWLVIFFSGLVS